MNRPAGPRCGTGDAIRGRHRRLRTRPEGFTHEDRFRAPCVPKPAHVVSDRRRHAAVHGAGAEHGQHRWRRAELKGVYPAPPGDLPIDPGDLATSFPQPGSIFPSLQLPGREAYVKFKEILVRP
jgi:hypothetical protein